MASKRVYTTFTPAQLRRLEKLAQKLGGLDYSSTLRYCFQRTADAEGIPEEKRA